MPLRAAARGIAGLSEHAITLVGLLADEVPRQRAVLRETGHRPWPLPEAPWLMGQTWYDLLFAHWPVPFGAVRRLVPSPLELEERDGRAWIGVTPFVVGGLRSRGMPPLPWVSRFPELNVRTYVSYGGRQGIYFFSLDAARLAAVLAARRGYRLPYFHARMTVRRAGATIRYESRRVAAQGPPVRFDASYGPFGAPLRVEEGSLERWLSERYCLYVVDEVGRPLRAEIHHPPWPLHRARADIATNTMVEPLGIGLDSEPLLHFSPRQDVVIWPLSVPDR